MSRMVRSIDAPCGRGYSVGGRMAIETRIGGGWREVVVRE
jgi:hypothetical protein